MSRNAKINTLLLLVVVALAVLPLALGLGDHKEEPFAGADAEAETAITELRPDYEPWFAPLYEPPSGEVESALFALQAALGAGVLAYYFGLRRGRRQGEAHAERGMPVQSPGGPRTSAPGAGASGGRAPGAASGDAGASPEGARGTGAGERSTRASGAGPVAPPASPS
ncbi:energy-coupling factor ABC transporter substrate-binding protein, partial [Streptomyces sp.]